jgi:hypothetical protein
MPHAFLNSSGNIQGIVAKLTPAMTVPDGGRIVSYNPPYYDHEIEALEPVLPVAGNEVLFKIKPLSADVVDSVLDTRARAKREELLLQSDWTQLVDVPLPNKAGWQVYRQALRDITEQAGYPKTIDWPTPP